MKPGAGTLAEYPSAEGGLRCPLEGCGGELYLVKRNPGRVERAFYGCREFWGPRKCPGRLEAIQTTGQPIIPTDVLERVRAGTQGALEL